MAEGSQILVDGSASTDPDGTIASYAWDLDGDGQYDDGSGSTATLRPDQDGTRAVGLTVVDDSQQAGTASRIIVVTDVTPTWSCLRRPPRRSGSCGR